MREIPFERLSKDEQKKLTEVRKEHEKQNYIEFALFLRQQEINRDDPKKNKAHLRRSDRHGLSR